MKKTKRGIYYDLEDSEYVYTNEYGLTFAFSSLLYLNKFTDLMYENREDISMSLSNRFGFYTKNDVLSDIVLYTKIEKRGFMITKGGEVFLCVSNLILNGEILTQHVYKKQ